jgi:hypothetical protein
MPHRPHYTQIMLTVHFQIRATEPARTEDLSTPSVSLTVSGVSMPGDRLLLKES